MGHMHGARAWDADTPCMGYVHWDDNMWQSRGTQCLRPRGGGRKALAASYTAVWEHGVGRAWVQVKSQVSKGTARDGRELAGPWLQVLGQAP